MALDEATIERALTRVLGYVDPVAHALATKAAARDETTIAAALKNVLGEDDAKAVQEAVQNRQGPSDEESSSDDEHIDAPAWASERDLDEAVAAFDAWVQPDADERRRADDLFARITQTIKEVDPFARVELRGSRASGCALFDADVDVVVEVMLTIEGVAEALGEAEWSRGAELIRARVPIVTGKDASTNLAFDVATTQDAARQAAHAYGTDLDDASFSQNRPPHRRGEVGRPVMRERRII